LAGAPVEERLRVNQWHLTRLASAGINLTDYLLTRNLDRVDFIKIDVDGPDFAVLNSLDAWLDKHAVLGFLLEVNFVGSEIESDHTFHNTDRFMRSKGFDLFDLSIRRYSTSVLPSPYHSGKPGRTFGGRPLQGDALYLRDLASPDNADVANSVGRLQILKLAAMFSLFDLPDCTAELLVCFKQRLGGDIDLSHSLDLLARQSQRDYLGRLSYRRLMAAFANGSWRLHPQRTLPLFHFLHWFRTTARRR
jgi:hypothetical protein